MAVDGRTRSYLELATCAAIDRSVSGSSRPRTDSHVHRKRPLILLLSADFRRYKLKEVSNIPVAGVALLDGDDVGTMSVTRLVEPRSEQPDTSNLMEVTGNAHIASAHG